MRRLVLMLSLLAAALWPAPSLAQPRSQLGPLCTTDTTPADQMIDACNKIVALKVFSGEVQQMLTRVRAEVVAATKSKQVPWSNSSLLGEVFLAAKP
jgi:uncharacterized caspase-like protein